MTTNLVRVDLLEGFAWLDPFEVLSVEPCDVGARVTLSTGRAFLLPCKADAAALAINMARAGVAVRA